MAKKKKKSKPQQNSPDEPTRQSAQETSLLTIETADNFVGVGALSLVFLSPLIAEGTAEQFTNWIPMLLWILLAAATCGIVAAEKNTKFRLTGIDVCFYGVVSWITISGLFSFLNGTGHARPTINSTWQWVGYAVAYFVIRRQVCRSSFRRSAILVMVTVSIGCSVSAVYQRYIVYPEVWNNYQEMTEPQKQETLRLSGLSNVETGSRERVMWENRLYATSPTSTFVLTNSLAAFLTPWLVSVAAMVFLFSIGKQWKWLGLFAIGGILISLALLMTKSRTSYLAAGIGVVGVVAACSFVRRIRVPKAVIVIFLVVVFVLVGGGFLSGIVDLEVVSESFKSLAYRLEYWQASFSMIQEKWFLGCGPGNFQHSYARYQLVQASETVSDPHNFFIEIGAIAGTPALVFLLVGILIWLSGIPERINASRSKGTTQSDPDDSLDPLSEQIQLPIAAVLGTILSLFVALLNDMNLGLCAISGLIGIVLSLTAMQLKFRNEEWAVLPAALIALAIGLSASGGIGFPSVALSGILLLALTAIPFNESDAGRDSLMARSRDGFAIGSRASRGIHAGLLFVFLLGAFGFRLTVIDPIQKGKELSSVAELEAGNGDFAGAVRRMDLAIKADPYDGNFVFFKLQLLYSQFQRQPSNRLLNELVSVARKSVTVRPNNSKVALETGKLFLSMLLKPDRFDENTREQLKYMTLEFFEIATGRRPNDALHAAYRSFAHSTAGEPELARKWAKVAMELDELNPHQDKDLSNYPFQVQGYESGLDIEQELVKIRKQ